MNLWLLGIRNKISNHFTITSEITFWLIVEWECRHLRVCACVCVCVCISYTWFGLVWNTEVILTFLNWFPKFHFLDPLFLSWYSILALFYLEGWTYFPEACTSGSQPLVCVISKSWLTAEAKNAFWYDSKWIYRKYVGQVSVGSSKKWDISRKTSTSVLLTMPKPFTVWITTNWGKFYKRWEYQTTSPTSWEICM